eukprot:Hpha_TRINITY_DN15373_c1_g3::TRINITY_DN15373_c1_g3_i1::g.87615::m.87615
MALLSGTPPLLPPLRRKRSFVEEGGGGVAKFPPEVFDDIPWDSFTIFEVNLPPGRFFFVHPLNPYPRNCVWPEPFLSIPHHHRPPTVGGGLVRSLAPVTTPPPAWALSLLPPEWVVVSSSHRPASWCVECGVV